MMAHAWIDGDLATKDELLDHQDVEKWWAENKGKRDADGRVPAFTGTRRTMHGTYYDSADASHPNQVYVLVRTPAENGTAADYEPMCHRALAALFASDERIRSGNFFSIGLN